MRKIVVTGGAGFIGSHLIESLLTDTNNQVLVIDDMSVGKLSNLPKSKRLLICQSSILADDLSSWNFFNNVDVVYHLAALTRPRWSIEHPLKTNRVNVTGTLKVLDGCVKGKIGKFVFVSSGSVYGEQKKLPLTESMRPMPMNPYGLTKEIGEKYCELYSELYNLKYAIVRPFNTYGPRQGLEAEYSSVVSSFISKLHNGEAPAISGSGRQGRDFIFVKDVADLLVLVGKHTGSGEVFNAGSGKTTSINTLFKLISKIMKKNVKPGHRKPTSSLLDAQADIKKAKRLLGWEPKVTLENGLRQTIDQIQK